VRLLVLARRPKRTYELSVRDREVALPDGIARVGFRQTLGNRQRGLIAGERRHQVALRHLHIADLVVRDREIALPAGIARVRFRQTSAITSAA